MKSAFFTSLFFFASILLFGQNFNPDKLSVSLQQQLHQNHADDIFFNICILLEDQIDIHALKESLDLRNASIAQRSFEVNSSLKAKALATQPDLLELLRNSDDVLKNSVRELWVTNVIFAKANKDMVAVLSNRNDVASLDLNHKIELLNYTVAPETACQTSVMAETGLHTINAHKLWEMGYTGYGRNAYIIDTGTDEFHPSLKENFRGKYVPMDEAWAGTNTPVDCAGHGTHVTGTTVGLNRLTHDTIGVAFDAHWMAAPPVECGMDNTVMDVVASLQWALNPDDNDNTHEDMPDAINNSYGVPSEDVGEMQCNFSGNTFVSTLTALEAAGVAVIYAAGNDGPGTSTVTYQGNINAGLVNSFSVGNINANSASLPIAFGSSRGPSLCITEDLSLDIKPEVVAPGTQVRSAIPGNGFANFSGTSMASPHVTGAVCLLRQAFPEITGEAIKLALYHSAVDLGAPGEDNDYGNGLIDCLAAYNFLVAEGNTPVPAKEENDALAIRVFADNVNCNHAVTPVVLFENSGTNTITSIEVEYAISGFVSATGTASWNGSVAPGERMQFQIPPVELFPVAADYDIKIEILNVNGQPDSRPLNNIVSGELSVVTNDAPVPFVVSQLPVCSGTEVELSVTENDDFVIYWYDQVQGGSSLASGVNFTTPPLSATTTFYVETINISFTCNRVPITIEVLEEAAPVADFTIENLQQVAPSVMLDINNQSLNADNYSWDFGDGFTSTDAAPEYAYAQEGTYTISLEASNAAGCLDVFTREIVVGNSTGVETFLKKDNIRLFPNPAGKNVTIQFDNNHQMIDIKLLDMLGRTVAFYPNALTDNFQFSVANLEDGVYSILFSNGQLHTVKKILVAH